MRFLYMIHIIGGLDGSDRHHSDSNITSRSTACMRCSRSARNRIRGSVGNFYGRGDYLLVLLHSVFRTGMGKLLGWTGYYRVCGAAVFIFCGRGYGAYAGKSVFNGHSSALFCNGDERIWCVQHVCTRCSFCDADGHGSAWCLFHSCFSCTYPRFTSPPVGDCGGLCTGVGFSPVSVLYKRGYQFYALWGRCVSLAGAGN